MTGTPPSLDVRGVRSVTPRPRPRLAWVLTSTRNPSHRRPGSGSTHLTRATDAGGAGPGLLGILDGEAREAAQWPTTSVVKV